MLEYKAHLPIICDFALCQITTLYFFTAMASHLYSRMHNQHFLSVTSRHQIWKLVRAVVLEIIPLKNLRYFVDYFDTCRQIADTRSGHSRLKWLQMRLAQLLEFTVGLRFLYFYLCPIRDPMELIIWYDTIQVMHLKESVNLMAFTISLMMCYLYECFYFQNWGPTGQLLYQVMIEQNCAFFSTQTHEGMPIFRIVQRTGLLFLNGFQVFVFILDCFGISSMLSQIFQIYEHRDYFTDWSTLGPLKILCALFNTSFFFLAMLNFAHCCILTATLSITSTRLIFVRLAQLRAYLATKNLRLSGDGRKLLQYFTNHTAALQVIMDENRIYGKAFFAYLLITVPLNALLTLSIFMPGKVALENRLYLGAMAFSQFIYIFGIHLMCAAYTKKIHENVKRLQHLSVWHAGRIASLVIRYKLAVYIEKFHTTHRYGITYGKTGVVITFVAFIKYLMFYGKFLCKTYKSLRESAHIVQS